MISDKPCGIILKIFVKSVVIIAEPLSSVPNSALPAIPNNGTVNLKPQNDGFEIIQWGK